MNQQIHSSSKYIFVLAITLFYLNITGCSKKNDNPVKYSSGFFPDTVINMGSINSQYDDYNLDLYQLSGSGPVIFSSNRNSSGNQFDLVQGMITFVFDQTNGNFSLTSSIGNDSYISALITKANTQKNEFGPYRFYCNEDGYEYLMFSSVNSEGNLDIQYLRNRPQFSQAVPQISGPVTVSVFNSTSDDAYFSINSTQDTAYLCSSRNGDFDIYMLHKPPKTEISAWFIQNGASLTAVTNLNSSADDKCPQVFGKVIVFSSDRPGGLGGFDLYYSVMKNGSWSSPMNFGPSVNSASNEYRPVLGLQDNFTNYFMMFSSDRPGGQGGYDLYFTGIDFE
ncbi:MAG TPA: hypothetical protein VHO46_08945 [Bacteroidales bacterium]|nr:hypothetical protein [Bacteroidales bacterium]